MLIAIDLIAFGVLSLLPTRGPFAWAWLALIVGISIANLAQWRRDPDFPFRTVRQLRERYRR